MNFTCSELHMHLNYNYVSLKQRSSITGKQYYDRNVYKSKDWYAVVICKSGDGRIVGHACVQGYFSCVVHLSGAMILFIV